MKRLILMRHAKSDWSATGDDHSRPLNKRGRGSAPVMGEWLREKAWLPDEVLCSTATRTRQTLVLLGLPEVAIWFERSLYLADSHEIIEEIQTAAGNTVLVLGHNYGMCECANMLVKAPPDHPRFSDYPTCATALISFDVDDWSDIRAGRGICEDFAVPRDVVGAQPG